MCIHQVNNVRPYVVKVEKIPDFLCMPTHECDF